MSSLAIAGALAGFLSAQFAAALWSEQFAEWFIDSYANGFYTTPVAPSVGGPVVGAITDADRDLVADVCLPAENDPFALSSQLPQSTPIR